VLKVCVCLSLSVYNTCIVFMFGLGASIVGLGEKVGALYSSDDKLLSELLQAAKRSDESIWHMPLEAAYKPTIKGTLTDLKNLGTGKGGGSITAALFLQEFVEKTPWAHIGTETLSAATKNFGNSITCTTPLPLFCV
jgi:leucyl aminopeptidase